MARSSQYRTGSPAAPSSVAVLGLGVALGIGLCLFTLTLVPGPNPCSHLEDGSPISICIAFTQSSSYHNVFSWVYPFSVSYICSCFQIVVTNVSFLVTLSSGYNATFQGVTVLAAKGTQVADYNSSQGRWLTGGSAPVSQGMWFDLASETTLSGDTLTIDVVSAGGWGGAQVFELT